MSLGFCPCPYIPCPVRGNCEACAKKNMAENELCNCAERIAIQRFDMVKPVNPIQTVRCADYMAVSVASAKKIQACLADKPDALLCFPAGSTAVGTFEVLKRMKDAGEIDFSQAFFVALDEWLDLEDESENCTQFMMRNFYEPCGIRKDQMRLFDIHSPDFGAECREMDQYIFSHGKIDLLLLGIGMNGHLGLIEPNETWDAYTMTVSLSDTTMSVGQKYFSKPTALSRGITLGMRHIFEAKRVVAQVSGAAKAEIVHKVVTCQPDFDVPASVLKLLGDSYLIADEDALALVQDIGVLFV